MERRKVVCAATVNRELATLRRLLRLAHEWKEIDRVPKIRLLNGERIRDFVLSRHVEENYLAACAQPLADISQLILETGLRIGEALNLAWADVELDALSGSRFGYIRIREGKSKNARRTIPLTDKAAQTLRNRKQTALGELVFSNREGRPYLVTSINHLHQKARAIVGLGRDFVIHSLRHTMLTRLGSRESMLSRSCGLPDIAASSFRSGTCIRHLKLWSVLSSGCSFRATGNLSKNCCYRLQKSLQSAKTAPVSY